MKYEIIHKNQFMHLSKRHSDARLPMHPYPGTYASASQRKRKKI